MLICFNEISLSLSLSEKADTCAHNLLYDLHPHPQFCPSPMDRHHNFSFAVYLIFLLGTSDFTTFAQIAQFPQIPKSSILSPLLKVLHGCVFISFFVFLALQFMFLNVCHTVAPSSLPWNVQIQLEFLFLLLRELFWPSVGAKGKITMP